MAKAEQIKALIRSHAEGDDARFYAVAMQVAAHAARTGKGNVALELRELVDALKAQKAAAPSSTAQRPLLMAQPRGDLAGLLSVSYPRTRLSEMALEEGLETSLRRIVREQHQRDLLRSHGFSPQRKVLLVGPPGTGKTMTAAALAGELGVPLFTVQLDALITKFMGETAAKLRLVFEAIAETRGVYLFDEFDALGGDRGAANDVGEIRRVLNSFLQFLELDESDSLLIGATNHVRLLDQALFRRFDAVLEYQLPTSDIAMEVMKGRLALLETSRVNWDIVTRNAHNLSHAELSRACEQAAKDALLSGATSLDTAGIVAALEERQSMRRATQ